MNKIFLSTIITSLLFLSACTYVQKVKDGKSAYERKQFDVAVKMLKQEYSKEKSRVEKGKIAYMLGDSYSRKNQNDNATDWYQKAYDNSYGIDALKAYAHSLKKSEKYEEAKKAFKELGIEIGSPYEFRRDILACETAIQWAKETAHEYSVEIAEFSSKASDYAPSLYKDNLLVISSDRSSSLGEENYNWTGNKFMDLFIIDPNSNKVESFDEQINTPDNEGTVSFNQDYTEMYFTRCFDEEKNGDNYCKIMVSNYHDNSWTVPKVLSFVEDKVNYMQPSLSSDGGSLYFASNHSDGWGGYDIYVSEKTTDGWDYPQLLGRSINTEGNESFPFIDADTLYFSSDYHTGMGGLDIFKSSKLNGNSWSPAINLKTPINSGADDFGYVIDRRPSKAADILQFGYFTTSRYDGKGNDDIYQFEKRMLPPPPPPKIDTTIIAPPIVYKMILEAYIVEKIFEDAANPNSKILGKRPLPGAKVQINYRDTSRNITVGDDGMFSIELEKDMAYHFFGSKEAYLNNNANFSSKGIAEDPNNPIQKYELEIVLDKIFKNREITLENIYYNFDKWDIRNDAKPALNKLSILLQRNPQIQIQLSSHTDCQGKDNYNKTLSQKRAQSVVEYLISKGIASERLSAVGYGEANLTINCICTRCSEEEHQANRRTTFKILE